MMVSLVSFPLQYGNELLQFQELVLTASGDGTAHIWQCAVHLTNESSSGRMASSEDELDPLERESQAFGKMMHFRHALALM